MTDRIRISTQDNKYTYVMREDGSTYALRYGEPWIENMTSVPGNGMTLSFVHEIEKARAETQRLRVKLAASLKPVGNSYFCRCGVEDMDHCLGGKDCRAVKQEE